MPLGWQPRTTKIEERIAEGRARLEALKLQRTITEPEAPAWLPAEQAFSELPPLQTYREPQPSPAWFPTEQYMPERIPAYQEIPQPITRPRALPIVKPKLEAEPVTVPFWQRALQVFSAPFEWVDEYVIKPGLGMARGVIDPLSVEKRKPGEDFWEWKKRTWEAWEAPGIDIDVPWMDRPWRLDVKGVLELAPWLLIPGVGQVGGGVRGAVGIAGMLGKMGRLGRVAGYALQYSPWGLVEKTAGVALRAGVKGISKITGRVGAKVGERVFGKIPEPLPPTPAVQELTKFFDEAVVPARKAFEKALPTELRAKQLGRLEAIAKQYREGKITALQRQALEETALEAGSLKAQFAVKDIPKFSKEKMNDLLDPIYKAAETDFEAKNAAQALRNLLLNGEIPEPRFFTQFARAYGDDFAKSVKGFTQLSSTGREKILDVLNLPRAVLASGDLSATFRQGLILMLTHPTKAPRAFWRQLKHFASEKLSLEMDDVLRSHPLYDTAVKEWGVEFTALRKGARMITKEEPFYSNLAQQIPFIRRSERAFTGFLNEMRMGAVEASYNAMVSQGASPAQFKLMGKFINLASGRGVLPANLNQYAPLFNTVLFSAKYQMSTLQLPRQIGRMLLSGNPYMRKEAAKALITFVGGGSALLGLLKATGRGKVELDPRAGDFGKIVIGETRLDIWRGYIQYARFMAQMLTAERKSAYGNMNKAQRWEIAVRFLQSKASPAAGLIADIWKGENYMGEPVFNETTGFIKMARDRLLPLALQDVIDAMEQSGVNGLWTAAPATLGIGVLTYVNDLVRIKEKIAREMGYEVWDEIDPKTQREIENSNAELQAAYIQFDRQVMGTAWGDWRLAGQAIEDTFRENVELAVAQYKETGEGYQFREKITKSFTERRGGYGAREKMPQFEDIVRRLETEDTLESLVALGPEQLAIKVYNDALWGDDMYDEFGDYRFDEAEIRKQQLREQLGEEMFIYVEEYRGIKYEDLPPEFHLLTEAKRVMRPYWQVREEAIKIFGEPKPSWSQWRLSRFNAFVSRIRKRLRRTNPELEKYYQMFYTR